MNPRGRGRIPPERLSLLVANEQEPRLSTLQAVLTDLGHEVAVTRRRTYASELVERAEPDVVLVGRLGTDEHSLSLVERFVHGGSAPVVALLASHDVEYVRSVALRGAFAHVIGTDGRDLEAAIGVARERYTQYRNLQDAFGRRARVEQAKGILMAQRGIDEDEAFELLRAHARRQSRKISDVADAVIESHTLRDFPLGALIRLG